MKLKSSPSNGNELDQKIKPKTQKLFGWVFALIVLIVIIITGVYLLHDQPLKTKQLSGFSNKGSILLAEVNSKQDPPPANPENLIQEYLIYSLDVNNWQKKQLAVVKNNFFYGLFQLSQNTLYYLTPSGEISSLDLDKTDVEKVVKIPGITSLDDSPRISDFLVSGGYIFYLKGDCYESSCELSKYNLLSQKDSIIFSNLREKIEPEGPYTTVKIESFDLKKNILTIWDSGGDGGGASVAVYNINLNNSSITQTASAQYESCGEGDQPCTTQENVKNDEYLNITHVSKHCFGATIDMNSGPETTISIKGKNKTFGATQLIGCLSPK